MEPSHNLNESKIPTGTHNDIDNELLNSLLNLTPSEQAQLLDQIAMVQSG